MIHPIQAASTAHTPDSLAARLRNQPGLMLLGGQPGGVHQGRYSFVTARPFLTFRSTGSRCQIRTCRGDHSQFGNPWQILASWIERYEWLNQIDLPFPLGGCFGFWGYDLKNQLEPGLPQRALNDLALPECHAGFYGSLVVFDHHTAQTWIVTTGLLLDGSTSQEKAEQECAFWRQLLASPTVNPGSVARQRAAEFQASRADSMQGSASDRVEIRSNLTRTAFIAKVQAAQRYIRAGDVYQVNLAQRFEAVTPLDGWEIYQRLAAVSPAPFAAYMDCGEFQLASSSPELFLRFHSARVITRPIKGTRRRSNDAVEDTQLAFELQTSPKELSELVMITDLLRNDLGKVCEFGSIAVPELARLERFAQVQHLVSTVEGQLRTGISHLSALAACFPGGSITGAPKVRAMQIIDELEPVTRGPYTGALGYLGFNRESQFSILIRTAVCQQGRAFFHAGAGIVADSVPDAEYEETLAKAQGFFQALKMASITPVSVRSE